MSSSETKENKIEEKRTGEILMKDKQKMSTGTK